MFAPEPKKSCEHRIGLKSPLASVAAMALFDALAGRRCRLWRR
jgi:hypothetical protein